MTGLFVVCSFFKEYLAKRLHKSEYRKSWWWAWFFKALFTVVVRLEESTSRIWSNSVLPLYVSVTSDSFIIPPTPSVQLLFQCWKTLNYLWMQHKFPKGPGRNLHGRFWNLPLSDLVFVWWDLSDTFFVGHFDWDSIAMHWFCRVETEFLKVQLGSYGQIRITYHDLPKRSGISSKVVRKVAAMIGW